MRSPNALRRRTTAALVIAVVVVSTTLAGGMFVLLRQWEAERVTTNLEQRVDTVVVQVREELHRHRDLAVHVAAWLATNPDASRAAVDDYVARIGLADRYPGASSVAVIVPTSSAGLPRVAAGLEEPDGPAVPVHDSAADRYVVTASHRSDGRDPELGIDLSRAPAAAAALEATRTTGQPRLSDPYPFLSDADVPVNRRQQGVLVVAPVFEGPGDDRLRAWVAVAFRGDDFLSRLLSVAGRNLDITLTDHAVAATGAAGRIGWLGMGAAPDVERTDGSPADVVDADLHVAGQRWRLSVRPRASFLDAHDTAAPETALGTLLLGTVLLGGLVGRLASARTRAVAAVRDATSSLERANADLVAREETAIRTNARLAAVVDTQHEVAAAALRTDDLLAVVTRRAQELTGAAGAILEVPDGDDMVYRAASGSAADHVGLRLPIAGSLSGWCAITAEMARCDDTDADPRVNADACRRIGGRSMLIVPLIRGEHVTAVLKVLAPVPHAFDETTEQTLGLLAGTLAAALASSQEFEDRAFRDHLTGLPNRSLLGDRLELACARTARTGSHVALFYLDLDGFKHINDTHGHAAGDVVLVEVANRLTKVVRPNDTVARIGGDEFVVLCEFDDPDQATMMTERLHETITGEPVIDDGAAHLIGVSIGVATTASSPALPHELLAQADAAMYHRKRSATAVGR